MDVTDIAPQLRQLDADLDQLENALKPLLVNLGGMSAKLPLLDKAKLHVLVAYAIESLLFSTLRISEMEAKNHAIFTELTRVKQYFDKIKKAEEPPAKRGTTLNNEAAIRFVRAGVADNENMKERLTALIASERAKVAERTAKAQAGAQSQKTQKRSSADTADVERSDLPKRPKHTIPRGKK